MALMLSLKVAAISAAVILTAVGAKAFVPLASTHVISPAWKMCLLCLKPPLLFVVVNAIIISIVASSTRFFHQYSFHNTTTAAPLLPQPQLQVEPPEPETEQQEEEKAIDVGVVVEESSLIPLQTEFPPESLLPAEKPLLYARFAHRKPPKSTPEGGRALRVVAKAKRHDTLENTWKAITEGRAMPLSRHMKKCDTWQNRGGAGAQEVRKCETFNERSRKEAPPAPGSVRLRKEPSLSQDELNRRVEAFIRKFNEQMRLQRQESFDQYMQMINRGAA